jgi:UDP-GlcNAc:undecaprenyl-phosphate GlcNAc-1-phosphate transferase
VLSPFFSVGSWKEMDSGKYRLKYLCSIGYFFNFALYFFERTMEGVQYYLAVYGAFFCSVIVFSLLINHIFLKFSTTLGARNQGDGTVIRWGTQSKPALGGISFYIVFLLSIVCYSIFFDPNQVFLNKKFIGFMLAVNLGFLMGLADDAYNTNPLLKLSAQIACSLILILSGIYINFFESVFLNYFFTVFWVVGIMNSINMLDNMDAITTIVAINIVICGLLLMWLNNEYDTIYFTILVGILAALSGFLYYNWHPSRMYMGDTGSQFLGVLLAATGIMYFWNNHDPVHMNSASARQFILPVLIFLMPIIDTTCVVINRLSKKQSPFIGGKDHTTHSLAYMGLSDTQVALLFGGISLLSMLLIPVVISNIDVQWNSLWAISFLCYFAVLFFVFFYATKIRNKKIIS